MQDEVEQVDQILRNQKSEIPVQQEILVGISKVSPLIWKRELQIYIPLEL
jgi:hypothetical protein